MTDSVVEEIKNKLDIVEIIQSYIKLEKAGINYRALCPFHSEKTPSFFVSPARQMWHCFGSCGEGGDIFKFVMKIEGIEFPDALRILAQKAGVVLKKQDPKTQSKRKRLEEITKLACVFFQAYLEQSKNGKKAKEYLLKRGFTEKSIKDWKIGYSPEKWSTLGDFLISRGYKREEIVEAGLALQNQDKFYDRFRARIMFPIFNVQKQVIGFGGRVFLEKDTAKYINTPATLLYDKSRVLYGLDKASLFIRKKDNCILTEGYIDVIMSHQVGINNTVAVSGTALTSFQLNIIKRYTNNLVIAFDMDLAGDSATKRGIEMAQSLGFEIKVVLMPQGLDPADIVVKNQKEWFNLVEKAKSIYEFYLESTFSKYDKNTIEGKKAIVKNILPVLQKIPNNIEKSFWIKKLAEELKIKEEDIFQELNKIPVIVRQEEEIVTLKPANNRKKLLEQRILLLLVKNPDFLAKEDIDLFSDKEIIKSIKTKKKNEKLNELYLRAEREDFLENINQEFEECFKEFKIICLKERLNEISAKIIEAEKNNKSAQKLTKEFNKLSQTLCEFYQ
ncbi:MAG: DNA primase [Candidatus Pacebacteria bacterium]|nr:DNA primase [Candidatus Paceibacterota bacterium]